MRAVLFFKYKSTLEGLGNRMLLLIVSPDGGIAPTITNPTATPVILIHHHNIASLHHSHSPINWFFFPGGVIGRRAGWANHCSQMHLVCCLRPSMKAHDEDGWVGEADLIS